MDLVDFSDKLKAQGVELEHFLTRMGGASINLVALIDEGHSFRKLLAMAFDWGDTPEGYEYWQKVAKEISNEEPNGKSQKMDKTA